MIPTQILVVDDQEINLEILQEFLSRDSHFRVITASSGTQALDILRQSRSAYPIDLVLLDWMMPGMDGIAVLKEIKRDPILKDLPVIMQTAKAGQDDLIAGLRAGAFYYLTKPLDERILLTVVRRAIREYQKIRLFETEKQQFEGVAALFQSGIFRVHTVDEARGLSHFLSLLFPDNQRVYSGLVELLLNAVEHGSLGINYQEKSQLLQQDGWDAELERRQSLKENRSKYVTVSLEQDLQRVEVTITDQGQGFDWREYMAFNPSRILDNHGRGISIANNISFDELEYSNGGRTVRALVWRAPKTISV